MVEYESGQRRESWTGDIAAALAAVGIFAHLASTGSKITANGFGFDTPSPAAYVSSVANNAYTPRADSSNQAARHSSIGDLIGSLSEDVARFYASR